MLAGCSDDDEIIIVVTPDQVQVRDEADGRPVAGIKVVVMDYRSNVPVAGPVVSGDDGYCRFDIDQSRSLRLLVFGGVDYLVHSLPDYWYFNKGKRLPEGPGALTRPLVPLSAGVDKTPPTPPVTVVEVQVRKVWPDSLPRIRGQIVDAVTGAPLDQVFISISPYLSGYHGNTSASDDVTADDGEFSVSQIPFGLDPDTDILLQITPLRLTRQGYRPVIWSYDPPHGSDNLDIGGITITMTPLDSGDTGSISGRMMRDGLPVADLVVGLGLVDLPEQDKAGPGLTGWAEVTDQEGRYTIGGLPAGTYLLLPGFPLADGAFFPDQAGNVPVEVTPGQAIDAVDLIVLHEIEPQWPTHGRRLSIPPTTLEWFAVPGATSYEVRFDRGILPPTDTNYIELPDSLEITPGLHYWFVLAINNSQEIIGINQIQSVFRLLPPTE
jgi:hypothetical protein